MNKLTLRKKYLEIRNNIIDKDLKSELIFNKIINTKEYDKATVIAIYKSLDYEVNTDKLIDHSLSIGKTVLLPRVIDDDMAFLELTAKTILIKSNFGVFEPIADKSYPKDKIDLVIVPGVCFDYDKNRLGFGKGYYDKYLKDTKMKKIGICFEEQICKCLPTDSNDIKMDLIITDKQIINICKNK